MRSRVLLPTLIIVAWPSLLLAQQPPGPPGQPQVTIDANRYATVTWAPSQNGSPVAYYGVTVIHEDSPFPSSPFYNPIDNTLSGGPMPPGEYRVSVFAVSFWGASTSPPTVVRIPGLTLPRTPTLQDPGRERIDGDVLVGSLNERWDTDGYEMVVTYRATEETRRFGRETSYGVPCPRPRKIG